MRHLKLLILVLGLAGGAWAQCGTNGTLVFNPLLGKQECTGKVGAAGYSQTFAAVTTVTITAATHGQGTKPEGWCFDNSTPANEITLTGKTVAANGDVVFTWSGAKTGYCLVTGLGNQVGPAGATGATGATGSPGQGVVSGGTAGQALTKIDGTNYNTQWTSVALASQTISASSPLTGGGALSGNLTIGIQTASGSQPGALSSADWTTFNGKVSTSRTVATVSPLTGGGTLASDLSLGIQVANAGQNGYLSSTDWNTFNNKAPTASPTFSGTVTLPVTGITQCLHVNASGVLSGSGADCGTGSGSGGGISNMVTGAGNPNSNAVACASPSASNLSYYQDTSTGNLWTCTAANTWSLMLLSNGSGQYSITGQTGTAPANPTAGNVECYFNSVSNTQVCLDSSGDVFTMVLGMSSTASQWVTNVDANGVQHTSQPAMSDVSGVAQVTQGGTGQTSYTNGQLLVGSTTDGSLHKATITAGTNITVTNSPGGITIAATSGGTTAATTNALAGDGNGNAVAVTGSASNCVLVNGTSTPCSTSNNIGFQPTAQSVTSGVTTSVVVPFNTTLVDKSAAIPACADSSGNGQEPGSWVNTTTQMTIAFSPNAAFTGTCSAILLSSQFIYIGTNSGLPTPASGNPLALVTDATAPGVCNAGGGSSMAICGWTGAAWASVAASGSTTAFSAVTTGTNSTATMTVGSGGSIAPSSATAGVVSANQLNGTSLASMTTGLLHVTTTTGAVVGGLVVNADVTTGTLALSKLVTQTADTVVMNASGSTASPTAVAMPTSGTNGCAGATNALIYNTTTHTLGCNTISSSSVALSAITAGTGSNTIASGNNPQIWNWTQTSNNQAGVTIGETSAATNGTLGNQFGLKVSTAAGSTAVPLGVIDSLSGSQTLPALYVAPTWNTTGVVDAALLVNVTNTASAASSKLLDLQVGAVSQFSVDVSGNVAATSISSGGTPPTVTGGTAGIFAFTEGTAPTFAAAGVDGCYADSTAHGLLCSMNNGSAKPLVIGPTSSVSANLPSFATTGGGVLQDSGIAASTVVTAAGTMTNGQLISGAGSRGLQTTNLSGDVTTTNSAVTTVVKVNGVAYGTNPSSGTVPVVTSSNTITYEVLPLASIASIAADNLLGNASGISAAPVAMALTSCSSASNALTYNTSTHAFGCNTISGSGTVTTTGSPASGNLAKFSGATSVTNGDLSGDATTSGTLAVTVAKVNGVTYAASPSTDTAPIITAANTATYTAITNCGDATHALAYSTSTHLFSCQAITGSAAAGGSSGQLQWNNSTALGGVSGWTTNGTTTLTGGSTSVLDLSAMSATAGFKPPSAAAAAPTTAGVCSFDSTANGLVCGNGSSTNHSVFVTGSAPSAGLATFDGTHYSLTSTATSGSGNVLLASWLGTPVAGGLAYGVSSTQFGTTSAATSKQIWISGGAGVPSAIDLPDVHEFVPANCNSATAGSGFSLPASSAPQASCRTGTNVQTGYLQYAASVQSAQFQFRLPSDWDSGTNPYISVNYTQNGATGSQVIAFSVAVACNPTGTDDSAFNTAQNFTTTTTNTTAGTQYTQNLQLNSTSMTSCAAGGMMNFKIASTASQTAVANLQMVTLTIPRLLTVQAN